MRYRLTPFVLIVLTSFYVLFSPASGVPLLPPGVDKVGHFALFAALALTGRTGRIAECPLGIALIGYAAVSEVLQGVLPINRGASGWDLAADLSGVGIGLWLAGRARR